MKIRKLKQNETSILKDFTYRSTTPLGAVITGAVVLNEMLEN